MSFVIFWDRSELLYSSRKFFEVCGLCVLPAGNVNFPYVTHSDREFPRVYEGCAEPQSCFKGRNLCLS